MMKAFLLVAACAEGLVPMTTTPALRTPKLYSNPVSYLSNIEQKGKIKAGAEAPSDAREHVQTTEQVNGAPANYDGFVDSEGFDGGDGQVGVVGDGTNAMETYDMSQSVKKRVANAVGGSESKKNRANAWGHSTGYADELKKKGMTNVDEYGEDRLQARRQQLENWQNQRDIRAQKEAQIRDLYGYENKAYSPRRQGSYMDSLGGNQAAAAAEDVPRDYILLEPGDKVEAHIDITAPLHGRGGATISLQNEYSTYADFLAGFAPGSDPSITVEPSAGTLNRRGGQPQEFILKFSPETTGQPEYRALFVVETEDYKWTYTIMGKTV